MYTEGRLIVEFTFDDIMRIRSWHFAVRNHRELIPRSILAMQEPGMVESLSKNVTRQGLTSTTLNYLRVRSQFDYADASHTLKFALLNEKFKIISIIVYLLAVCNPRAHARINVKA